MTILSFVLPPFFHLTLVSWPRYQRTLSLRKSTALTEKFLLHAARYYDPQQLQDTDRAEGGNPLSIGVEGEREEIGGIGPVVVDAFLVCAGALFCVLGTYISADAIWEHFRNGTACS